jgi:hypothetical protein
MPDNWTCPDTGKVFLTGASPSPRHALLGAMPFVPIGSPPPQVAYVPKYRSNFGNDRYGVCVTAEEGFAKSCNSPEIEIPEQTVISYARSNNELNGANLSSVLSEMARHGFQVGSQLYNDGSASGVDFSNETILQSAIAQGPVKIAIAAGSLPGGAGSQDGWFSLSSRSRNTDHCVSLCGYGPAEWLYQQLGLPIPNSALAGRSGYLLYTWSTIGFVTHDWIMGTTDEAWVRNPTTIGVPPLTPPPPPPGPTPVPTPVPPRVAIPFTLPQALPADNYVLVIVPQAKP